MEYDPCFKRGRTAGKAAECHILGSLIGAGASIIGGMMGADAAEDAAREQRRGADEATRLQREIYEQQRKDLAPYRDAGLESLGFLRGSLRPQQGTDAWMPGNLLAGFTEEDFRTDPGYQFRLSEGEKAINRAAAARSGYANPATVRELMRYNQGQADQTYNDAFNRFQVEQGNRFNRLASLAGIGQTATNTTVGAAQNLGSALGRNALYSGEAAGQGIVNAANARISGLTGAAEGITGGMGMNRLGGGFGGGFGASPNAYGGMYGAAPNASWGSFMGI